VPGRTATRVWKNVRTPKWGFSSGHWQFFGRII